MAVGDAVMMLDGKKWKSAKVIAIHQAHNNVIKTPEGQTYSRNRQHLKRISNENSKANLTINDDYLSDDSYNEHEYITNDTSTTERNTDDIQPLQTSPPVIT